MELRSEGSLHVRITAAPVDGAANAALLQFLSRILDVPKSHLAIVAGHTARHKRIVVTGVAPRDLERRLTDALRGPN